MTSPDAQAMLTPANRDCLAKAKPGEPMFIILGRDPDGANIVRLWAQRRKEAGGDPSHYGSVFDIADAMDAWRAAGNLPESAPDAELYPPLTRTIPAQPSSDDTEMCDACNGSGFGVADTYCGKCGGAGGYPVQPSSVATDGEVERLKEWAFEKSRQHHELAHSNEHLRTEHIASSAAYRELALEIEALAHQTAEHRDDQR